MKQNDIELYLCPACSDGEFVIEQERTSPSTRFVLRCGKCGEKYPVNKGIPRFARTDEYASSFGMQWNLNRRTQLDSFTGLTISRDRLFTVTQWPQRMEGERILEAGSGAGRFTEVLLDTGADVFSFDLSSAVEANGINNGQRENLHLFQGDIYRIPLPRASFDKVISLGVIQHTPDPEGAFRNLVEYLRPGGMVVIDIYKKSLSACLQWKYLLRPLTKRMDEKVLYSLVQRTTERFLPVSRCLERCMGRIGSRLLPTKGYSIPGLSDKMNLQWSILDTFDMYSPAHDHPQRLATVKRWFAEAGLRDAVVEYGINGIIGRGYKV